MLLELKKRGLELMLIISDKIKERIRNYYQCFQKSDLKNDKLASNFVEKWIELLETIEKHHSDVKDTFKKERYVTLLKATIGFFIKDGLTDDAKAHAFQAGYDFYLYFSQNKL